MTAARTWEHRSILTHPARRPSERQDSPPPLAFFPLTGGELDSLLLPPYNGSTSGMPLPGWVDDATFNSTINCTAVRRQGRGCEHV